jgi:DnaJ family protein C protein 3
MLLATLLQTCFAGHLEDAKLHLNNQRYTQALESYESAIAEDPTNHLIYFMRATAYLVLGKNHMAIQDFDTVLSIKPDHHKALLQRSKLLLLQGSLSSVLSDLTTYLSTFPNEPQASELLASTNSAISLNLTAYTLIDQKKYPEAVSDLNQLLSICPLSITFRISRGDCHFLLDEKEMAISDYSRALKQRADNMQLYVKLSQLRLSLGETSSALSDVKECLRHDPDQRECKAQFRLIKRLEKQLSGLDNAAKRSKWSTVLTLLIQDGLIKEIEAIKSSALLLIVYRHACIAYSKRKEDIEAITFCTKVLNIDENDFEALLARAESYTNKSDFTEGNLGFTLAIEDYKKANNINRNDNRVHEGHSRAVRMQKKAGMVDYYKLLDVSKTASTREIKKAYRRQAQLWHPDKYKGDLSMEDVQKKMAQINLAYEVLSNEESRAKYDNGEDPNVIAINLGSTGTI